MAPLLRRLLLFVQLTLSLAQTTTIDVPFFNISSQPITAAVHWVESSTTVLSFSCDKITTSDLMPYCADNSAFPYDALTMAPVLDAMTYSLGEPRGYGTECWLVPEGSSSIAVCDMRHYDSTSMTVSDLSTIPVTITSGMDKLSSAALDTTDSSLNSALTTLKVPMPGDGYNRLNYASILSEDDTATLLTFSGRCAPLGDWYSQTLTLGPSTWNFVNYDDTLTVTSDCTLNTSNGAATCTDRYENEAGVETSVWDPTSIDTIDVTITQAPFAAQTTIEVTNIGFVWNDWSITASVVSADEAATSLRFKLGAGPDYSDFYTQALLVGPSTYVQTLGDDAELATHTCNIVSEGSAAVCIANGTYDGTVASLVGSFTTTHTYQQSHVYGLEDTHVVSSMNVTITAGAEKLPGYTPTTPGAYYGPSATPGSASTGALPSATDSTSGSPGRSQMGKASLISILLSIVVIYLL